MARTNQEAVTAFGEVLRSTNVSGSYDSQNNRMATTDNRLMIYFQGMKLINVLDFFSVINLDDCIASTSNFSSGSSNIRLTT